MEDSSRFSNQHIGLDTDIDTLMRFKIISVRSFNCLERINVKSVRDLLKVEAPSLISINKVGRKTISEISTFQNLYSHLITNDSLEEGSAIELEKQMPLSRADLSFLTDNQYYFCIKHWDLYDTIPAAFILYHYVKTSSFKSNVLIRDFFGVEYGSEPLTLEELALKNDISRERARQMSLKQFKLPRNLNVCRKQLQELFSDDYFCIDLDDFAFIAERENIPGGAITFAKLLACFFNFVVISKFVPKGATYIIRRRLFEVYPLKVAFKNIDKAFRLSPGLAPLLSLDKLVRITQNSIIFQELEKVFNEYIRYNYPEYFSVPVSDKVAQWGDSNI